MFIQAFPIHDKFLLRETTFVGNQTLSLFMTHIRTCENNMPCTQRSSLNNYVYLFQTIKNRGKALAGGSSNVVYWKVVHSRHACKSRNEKHQDCP